MLYDLIGVPESELSSFLEDVDGAIVNNGSHYKHKKTSAHSSVSLKFDKFILENVLKHIQDKKPTQGAFAKKSIKELLNPHKNQKYIFISDIKQYFENINYSDVAEEIKKCTQIANSVEMVKDVYFTKDDQLKRGLKASAPISEIVGLKIDSLINSIIHENSSKALTYTRYYDDLMISSDNIEDLKIFKKKLEEKLNSSLGLKLNVKKSRLRVLQGTKALGMRYHNGQVRPTQKYKKKLRAIIFQYKHSDYDENDIYDVYAAKKHVGTVIGSIRYLLDNKPDESEPYEELLADHYEELNRLDDIAKELSEYEE